MSLIKKFINKIFYVPRIVKKGKNNIVDIHKTSNIRRLTIEIYGNNNKVIFDENTYLHNTKIIIGFKNCPVENCVVKIGKKTGFNNVLMQLGESNSRVDVGSNCMFSYGVEINCTDHHSIFDENNKLINIGKSVTIGSHVWVCKKVTIMKNTNVPDGCILAEGSIITKHFDKENCVIAGNPAKVVKENIHWDKIRPQNFIDNRKQTSR